jgi:hypothetical protein
MLPRGTRGYHRNVSPELLAIGLIVVVHFLGAAALIWALFGDEGIDFRGFWPDDDGGHGDDPPPGDGPRPGPGGVPLADAEPSGRRLRGPERVGDWRRHGRPQPQHPPRRTPVGRG